MLHVGMVSPHALKVEVRKQTSDTWSPAGVTGATVEVKKPDGTTETWTGTVGSVTTNGLVVTKAFSSGDLDQNGMYRAYVKLTFVSGTLRTNGFQMEVAAEFEVDG